jgi:hypothetical protein
LIGQSLFIAKRETAASMWQRMRELPVEIAGSKVFPFLEVKDIVRMERAVVHGAIWAGSESRIEVI